MDGATAKNKDPTVSVVVAGELWAQPEAHVSPRLACMQPRIPVQHGRRAAEYRVPELHQATHQG